jgi:hypothetical protein
VQTNAICPNVDVYNHQESISSQVISIAVVMKHVIIHAMTIAYETDGDGPVVLFIHGWAA